MQGQKSLSLSYNMHLFLPYLLTDSQTIRSTIYFSKPLLCVTLICSDWSSSFKAVFVRAVLLCVQCYRGNRYPKAPKAPPSGKEWICIFIQTKAKIKFSQVCTRNKWAGNMLMFHVDVNGLGFVLKMTRFSDSESTLSFERQSLYTRCTFRFKTLQDVFIHMKAHLQKFIIGAL